MTMVVRRDCRSLCYLPLRERAGPNDPLILMSEGSERSGEAFIPIERVEPFALPSPARGEGTAMRTARAALGVRA
jgi:hypothetical protein